MGRGLFLAFEGGDGSGKSTQARRVASVREALYTFEPGDTPLGQQLRSWLLDADVAMSPATEALLMLADRSHHVSSVIAPALEQGRHVVSDRFLGSTIAYQGYGRGVDLALLQRATELAVGSTQPDLTILIDVPLEVAEARGTHSGRDRFESADRSFRERVRQGFLTLAATMPNWVVIDGSQSLEHVSQAVDDVIAHLTWAP
jgi:dTMP kinase